MDQAEQTLPTPAQSLIDDAFAAFDEPLEQYRWPWEAARWHELVFCLAYAAGGSSLDPTALRASVVTMGELGMLDPQLLATAGDDHPDMAAAVRLLTHSGLEPERATQAMHAVMQAARQLEPYDYKVQRLLREAGERVLTELTEQLALSELPAEDVHHGLTHWLQNVLDLPLVSSQALGKIAAEQGVTVEELVAIADQLDANVALLDDALAAFTG